MSNTQSAFIAHLPGLVFFKNTDLIYTAASHYAARLCGFETVDQFCGHNDFELRCEAAGSALDFRAEDFKVLATDNEISSLQIHKFADGNIHIFLVHKAAVKNDLGQIIGIGSMGNEVTNPATGQAIFNLLSDYASGKSDSNFHNKTFSITHENFNQLSARESEVIFYFMRGFTNKEIGLLLLLSPRTIESYLESIKCKLNCTSRKELLLKCMHSGFSYIIPQTLLQRCLNKSISWEKSFQANASAL
jgi:DNA-binding NarL/FixJ family response regulator